MKTRFFVLVAVVVCLLSVGLAVASGAEPPPPPARPPLATWPAPDLPPAEGPQPPSHLFAAGLEASAAVDTGRPGTNFRYVQTFGATDIGYFDDPNHLNNPQGIATDGSNIWIVEGDGRRALKYTSGGTFLAQIGQAAFQQGMAGTVTAYLAGVAVDAGGNTWLVDRGAHHVMKFNASGALVSELGSTWNSGSDNAHFDSPNGIAFDGLGYIYISDTNNHRVQIFDSTGAYTATLGVTGVTGTDNARFNGPVHITISGSFLYVADANNHRVQIFDISNPAAPSYAATLGTSGVAGSDSSHLNSPQGVAVGGGRIFVADGYNNRVQIFSLATRLYQSTLGGFSFVGDVAVDAGGQLYVVEPWLSQSDVQQFDSSLTFVRRYGTYGVPYLTDSFHYNRPHAVAVAPDGSLYIGEANGRRVVKLNADGTVQWVQGMAGMWGGANNQFAVVEGLALDPAGRVYAADTPNQRVQIFTAGGVYVATLGQTNTSGTGNNQFNNPEGVAVDPNGTIYVADTGNQRVQVFNSARAYVATIGVTGVTGADNAHFNLPRDVATDSAGNLYVVDQNNHRVQVFNSSRAYVRTLGLTGVSGNSYAHLSYPTAVAVDGAGRTYVAKDWGSRVSVFDQNGGYLTTVANWGWGANCRDCLDNASGLAVDASNNLYIADGENHRVEKYAFGIPGWAQTNINGFGDFYNYEIVGLAAFSGQLYASTYHYGPGGGQIWRTGDGISWSPVITDGFGANNLTIERLVEFDGQLYASTYSWNSVEGHPNGAQIWRSGDGLGWTNVVTGGLGEANNAEFYRMAVFSNTLFAGTWSYTRTRAAQIWSSGNGLDWTNVMTYGFGNPDNNGIVSLAAFNGNLYAGTWSSTPSTGGEVWRCNSCDSGGSWTQINADGFNTLSNTAIVSLAAFNGQLYAGTRNWNTGGQVWRCSTCDSGGSWEPVALNGFGNPQNGWVSALYAFDNKLYAATYNNAGLEVWRSGDGATWERIGAGGIGNWYSQNSFDAIAAFNSRLYLGTANGYVGAQIWQLGYLGYLPFVRR